MTELLRNLADGKLPFAELKQRAAEVKNMAALMWQEAAERYSSNYNHFKLHFY